MLWNRVGSVVGLSVLCTVLGISFLLPVAATSGSPRPSSRHQTSDGRGQFRKGYILQSHCRILTVYFHSMLWQLHGNAPGVGWKGPSCQNQGDQELEHWKLVIQPMANGLYVNWLHLLTFLLISSSVAMMAGRGFWNTSKASSLWTQWVLQISVRRKWVDSWHPSFSLISKT